MEWSHRRRIHLREISGDLDSPLETVGQDLRQRAFDAAMNSPRFRAR